MTSGLFQKTALVQVWPLAFSVITWYHVDPWPMLMHSILQWPM